VIHPAATVVLLRERAGTLEALLMRRRSTLGFLGGMWVFPGGRMEASDSSPEALERMQPTRSRAHLGLRDATGAPLAEGLALGHALAACREAFEEAGVLLACDEDGRPCAAGVAARLAPHREEITRDAGAFLRMLARERLRLDLGMLCYWSHWITPSAEPKRFDTRFFVAALPEGQSASADLSELTEHAWLSPAAAAAALERGELRMVPPTLYTLEDLAESHARHGSLARMLEAEAGRDTPPVMPRMGAAPGAVNVVMPWDPGYAALPGDSLAVTSPWPAHLARRRGVLAMPLPPDAR
jgi:8-oxo-dGTP pyrophosphatase MutT (NUDIX family)